MKKERLDIYAASFVGGQKIKVGLTKKKEIDLLD